MSIFNKFREIFIYSGLGQNQFSLMAGKSVPLRLLIRLYIILSSMLLYAVEGVLCMKYISYSLVDCLFAFVIMVSFLPVTTIYISLVMKTDEINAFFDYLESVISTSNAN